MPNCEEILLTPAWRFSGHPNTTDWHHQEDVLTCNSDTDTSDTYQKQTFQTDVSHMCFGMAVINCLLQQTGQSARQNIASASQRWCTATELCVTMRGHKGWTVGAAAAAIIPLQSAGTMRHQIPKKDRLHLCKRSHRSSCACCCCCSLRCLHKQSSPEFTSVFPISASIPRSRKPAMGPFLKITSQGATVYVHS